eukprot:1395495-Amorphochlora_amoeboformis.AAC.1
MKGMQSLREVLGMKLLSAIVPIKPEAKARRPWFMPKFATLIWPFAEQDIEEREGPYAVAGITKSTRDATTRGKLVAIAESTEPTEPTESLVAHFPKTHHWGSNGSRGGGNWGGREGALCDIFGKVQRYQCCSRAVGMGPPAKGRREPPEATRESLDPENRKMAYSIPDLTLWSGMLLVSDEPSPQNCPKELSEWRPKVKRNKVTGLPIRAIPSFKFRPWTVLSILSNLFEQSSHCNCGAKVSMFAPVLPRPVEIFILFFFPLSLIFVSSDVLGGPQ